MTPATRAARAALVDLHPDADQADMRALEADAERIAGAVVAAVLDPAKLADAIENHIRWHHYPPLSRTPLCRECVQNIIRQITSPYG